MTRKNLFEEAVHNEVLNRVEQLTAESRPEWGKMNAAQMLAHCSEVHQVMTGRKELDTSNWIARLLKGFIKRGVYGDKPYPKNGMTHPQYRIQGSDRSEFEREKAQFLAELTFGFEHREEQVEHPLFGRNPKADDGWALYKHHDHHLRQFGV